MKFAVKLAKLCNDREWSQRRLMPVVGRSASTLNAWFKGVSVPDVTDAFKLARALEVPLDWLADDAADWPPPSDQPAGDEQAILDLYRALNLTKEEALRGLALQSREGSDLLPGITRGLTKGGEEARDLAFQIIALGWRDYGYEFAFKDEELSDEDAVRWDHAKKFASDRSRKRRRETGKEIAEEMQRMSSKLSNQPSRMILEAEQLEVQGKTEEAIALWEKILKAHQNSMPGRLAEKRIKMLKGELEG